MRVTILVLMFALLIMTAVPVLALDYSPGVRVGQYVKYGNFYGWFTAVKETNWTQTEVVAVSGKVVTLRVTGEYTNGTAMTEFLLPPYGDTAVIDVLTGNFGGNGPESGKSALSGYVIPGNLNEGDQIPPLESSWFINKTETRTYLGINRTVNILERTVMGNEEYWVTWSKVYDKITGLLLEMKETQGESDTALSYGFSVVETNILSTTAPSDLTAMLPYAYVAIAAAISATAIVSFRFLKKPRKFPKKRRK